MARRSLITRRNHRRSHAACHEAAAQLHKAGPALIFGYRQDALLAALDLPGGPEEAAFSTV